MPINFGEVEGNSKPVADAGINQTVNENTTVTLNGKASDPDPTNTLAYSWRQIAGPEVILSNNNTTNPSFTSPSISSDITLKFSLTAKMIKELQAHLLL